MSYKVTIDGRKFVEKNKDEVILRLIAEWNDRTGIGLRVEWPDGTSAEELEFN